MSHEKWYNILSVGSLVMSSDLPRKDLPEICMDTVLKIYRRTCRKGEAFRSIK